MSNHLLFKMMGFFFLLISSSFLSTSFAAGRMLLQETAKETDGVYEGTITKLAHHEEMSDIHERLLRVNTKDYGRYDPSPTFVKPPFKLIPN